MSIFNYDNLSQSIKRFIHNGNPDYNALQNNPSKLLGFYLHCRKLTPKYDQTSLQYQMHQNCLKTIENSIFSLVSQKKIDDYHFIKLICNCPELLDGREAALVTSVNNFIQVVKDGGQDAKVLQQALKVCRWVRADSRLERVTLPALGISLSPSGVKVQINRLLWAAQIEGWRPMLLSTSWEGHNQVGLSQKSFSVLKQFIEEGSITADLNLDECLGLYFDAEGMQFPAFKNTILEYLLKTHLNNNTIVELLLHALETSDTLFIEACLKFLNDGEDSVILKWNPSLGLEVDLGDLNPNVNAILSSFGDYISSIKFASTESLAKMVDRHFDFPNLRHIEIGIFTQVERDSIKVLNRFPSVQRLTISGFVLQNIHKLLDREKISILHIIGRKNDREEWTSDTSNQNNSAPFQVNQGLRTVLRSFPNLKLCMIDSRKHCFASKGEVLRLGTLQNHVLDLSQLSQIMTDEILIELLKRYKPNYLNLRDCSLLTRESLKAIGYYMKDLARLELSGCTGFTDNDFLYLSQNLIDIALLTLKGCRIQDQTVIKMQKNLPDYCEIEFRKTSREDEEDQNSSPSKRARIDHQV